ncbi:hypothetical protein K1719_026358 [Acacia pycnantha]|nr:hypothetical protein K1719_026358 [Acacia pycnantha]
MQHRDFLIRGISERRVKADQTGKSKCPISGSRSSNARRCYDWTYSKIIPLHILVGIVVPICYGSTVLISGTWFLFNDIYIAGS